MHDDAKLAIISIVWRKITSFEYIAVLEIISLAQIFKSLLIHMQLSLSVNERTSGEQFQKTLGYRL
jgi:hypothetical protein